MVAVISIGVPIVPVETGSRFMITGGGTNVVVDSKLTVKVVVDSEPVVIVPVDSVVTVSVCTMGIVKMRNG